MKLIDLTGKVFGLLTVIKRLESKNGKVRWLCQCKCGTIKEISSMALRRGVVVSCGACSKVKDISGQRFGRLVVVKQVQSKGHGARWLCQCDCGNFKEVDAKSLLGGKTESCGCLHKERVSTHGMSKHSIYVHWIGMHQRCYNPNHPSYEYYGGKGIEVDWEWHRDNPEGFKNFIKDKGPITDPDKNTNDRFDNDTNYGPKNDNGWQDREAQARNQINNKIQSLEVSEFIRDLYFNKKVPIKNIAEFLDSSEDCVKDCVNRKTWTNK